MNPPRKPNGRGGPRLGSGRRPKYGQAMVGRTLKLPAEVWAQIDAAARHSGCTTQDWIRSIIVSPLGRYLVDTPQPDKFGDGMRALVRLIHQLPAGTKAP